MGLIDINVFSKADNWDMGDLHCHSYYELYYLMEGEREIIINNDIYLMKKNYLVVIPPFIVHKTQGKSFTRMNIDFSPDYLSKEQIEIVDYVCKFGPVFFKEEEKTPQINILLDKILYFYQKIPEKMASESMHILICYLFVAIKDHINNENINSSLHQMKQYPLVLINIIKYIKENINSDLTLKKLSNEFFFSEGYISKIFKKYTCYSLSDYILNLRLTLAKKLLRETNKRMEEISVLAGFSSSNYFSLIFKKKNKMSPLVYRKHYS